MNPHLYLLGLQIAMESAQRLVADLASGAATPGDAEAEIRESILELARKAGITLTPSSP